MSYPSAEKQSVHSTAHPTELNENLVHFPTWKELKNTVNTESVFSFAKYDSHLELLSKEFQERFYDFSLFEDQLALFSAQFTFDVTKANEIL